MNSILTFILIVSSVKCDDLCPLVKPNDTFKGLGLYHRYKEYGVSNYVMFNRAGHEWVVSVSKPPNIVIKISKNSNKSIDDKNVVNRFGTFAPSSSGIDASAGRPRDCTVLSDGQNSYQIVCVDLSNGRTGLNSTGNSDFVIMKGHPSDNSTERGGYVLVFNRHKKSEYFVFNPYAIHDKTVQIDCSNSEDVKCEVPPFIQQMDDSLFGQIDSVPDFSFKNGISGHIILFNIDGTPKYCTNLEDESLSEECKNTYKMTTFLGECFSLDSTAIQNEEPTLPQIQSEDVDDPGLSEVTPTSVYVKSEKSSNLLLIIVLITIVLIIIVGLIIGFGVYQKRKKNGQVKTEESLSERKSQSKSMDKKPADPSKDSLAKSSDKTVVSSKK